MKVLLDRWCNLCVMSGRQLRQQKSQRSTFLLVSTEVGAMFVEQKVQQL